jgi:hypothetical protein
LMEIPESITGAMLREQGYEIRPRPERTLDARA